MSAVSRKPFEIVEGAMARVFGEDSIANPYDDTNAPGRHELWEWGWRCADRLLELRIEATLGRDNETDT